MVAPGFLANPEVVRWLNGVMPAWTMLEHASFNALHDEPSNRDGSIRLEPKLSETDLSASAVTRTALALLQRASAEGLKLTATGNLSRAMVSEMCETIEWPGFDKDKAFVLHKVVNEPDFLPLHFVRVLLQATKLVRVNRDKLVPSRLGKAMLIPEKHHGALQALLFQVALWHLNLGYFDRNPIEAWPQTHVGVVLWSLSVSAHEWMDRETLTRLSTVPIIGLLESDWDLGSYAMESRILNPLLWFGLLERRTERSMASRLDRRLYRKTSLFDRFLKFNVQVERPATQH